MRKLFTKLYSCGGRTAAYKKFGDYADFFYNEKDFPVVGWRFEIADEDGQKVYSNLSRNPSRDNRNGNHA